MSQASDFATPSNPYAAPLTSPLATVATQSQSLEELVMSGHRIVSVPYAVSAVVISFRRAMGSAQVVSTGNWPVGKLFGATIVTMLFGWWGFPWGPVFSIGSLFHLWNGGRDLTKDVLTSSLGANEAKRILQAAPKPEKPGAIWLLRLLILLPVIWVVLIAVFGVADRPVRPY